LVQLIAKHLFKLQPLVELIGLFIWRFELVMNVDLTGLVVIASATQSPAAATQALQVVAPDFMFEQLEQRAFMTRQEDVEVFVF